ncbi:hyalin-like [Patiria miniata]|uniref:Hyalin n=1 Tax=Patiria miniata TaxID=46514 RepID=A0A913ZKS4_PATMI|nr:hyalin-like [Patiria miniata]
MDAMFNKRSGRSFSAAFVILAFVAFGCKFQVAVLGSCLSGCDSGYHGSCVCDNLCMVLDDCCADYFNLCYAAVTTTPHTNFADSNPPTFTTGCPGNITRLVAMDIESIPVSWPELNASDPSLPLLWNSSHQPGHMFQTGEVSMVTYIVTDNEGNSAHCDFTVTVTGVELRCPANITAATDPGSNTTSVSWAQPQVIFSSPHGQDTSAMRAHLDHVSSGDYYFIGSDDDDVNDDDDSGSGVLYFRDDGGTPIRLLSENHPGEFFSIGSTPVFYRVEGTEIECDFVVIVEDNEPPKLYECPADVTIPVSSSVNQVRHRWTPPMASDNSGRQVDVTFSCLAATAGDCDRAGNGTFSVGEFTMMYRAEDASGNEDVCTFTVTVTGVELRCPANITAATDPGSNTTSVSWAHPQVIFSSPHGQDTSAMRAHLNHVSSGDYYFIGSDDDDVNDDDDSGSGVLYFRDDGGTPIRLLSENHPGEFFSIGSTPVVYRVEGTAIECDFFVIVEDNEPPKLYECPAVVTIPVSSSANQVRHRWTPPMASDNSGRQVDVTFSCLAATASDCDRAGNGTFSVGEFTMMYRAEDASGNEDVCTFTVTVTAVKLVCPANVSALASPGLKSTSVGWSEPDLTGWDGPTNFTSSSNPGVELLIGTHRVDFQQYFEAYNLNLECSFFVVVLDNEPPQLDDCPADVIIPVSSSANQVHHRWTPPMASDNSAREVDVTFSCSAATASDCNQAGIGTFSVGVSTITYKAEDASGNKNGCTFTVTVKAVEFVCPANHSVIASPGLNSTSVSWSEPDLTGWDGPTNFTSTSNPGVELLIGTHRVDFQQYFEAYNLNLECSFFVVVLGETFEVFEDLAKIVQRVCFNP